MAQSENSGEKQGGRFRKGQSGNPAGKPRGIRHRTTQLAEKLMGDDLEGIVRAVLDAAKNGDMRAAKMVLDRLAPEPKGRKIILSLPAVETVEGVLNAIGATVKTMAQGEISPEEASTIVGVLEAKRRAIETTELEARLKQLEDRIAQK